MLYDLNIAWSPHTTAAELDRTLRFSASLGYDVVAVNHTIGTPVPANITSLLPKLELPSSSSSSQSKLPTILRRATVVLNDTSQHQRLPQLASAYDILAVRPQTDESFSAACQSLNDISLISLDLTVRQPFTFRPKPCMFAVNRGIRFEVCYSQVLQGPAPAHVLVSKGAKDGGVAQAGNIGLGVDARARGAFIGNVSSLIRATCGRGIVLSSEARSVLGLRGPADVINLLHMWGLSTDRATEGLGLLPRGVVVNEGLKRSGFRGVIDIVGVADRVPTDVEMAEAGDDNAESASGNAQGKNDKKHKNQEPSGLGKKRKNGDNAETSATGDANGSINPGPDGEEQPMSKRQAKKMKAALRKKQTEDGETGI
ncbi:RNase P subunit p30-domain-containing protein [Xylaria digitata]|nr:RNase P subunit p30-domain-containing protein [Xylaria digitata]